MGIGSYDITIYKYPYPPTGTSAANSNPKQIAKRHNIAIL